MLSFLLLVVIALMVVGIIGFVVHGLFWLFVIAAVLFAVTVFFGGTRVKSRRS